MMRKTLPTAISIIIILSFITVNSYSNYQDTAYAQQSDLDGADILVVMVNLERIRAQILLTQEGLDNNDTNKAFIHAYIPHAVTFPSIKNILKVLDSESAKQLEAKLTDLPINIRAKNASNIDLRNQLEVTNDLLIKLSGQAVGLNQIDKGITLQTVTYLLNDAGKSYAMSNSSQSNSGEQFQDLGYKPNTVDYENALGLLNISSENYAKVSNLVDERRKFELDSFFNQIQESIMQKANQN